MCFNSKVTLDRYESQKGVVKPPQLLKTAFNNLKLKRNPNRVISNIPRRDLTQDSQQDTPSSPSMRLVMSTNGRCMDNTTRGGRVVPVEIGVVVG